MFRLLNCILWAAVKYCGFDPEEFPGLAPACPSQLSVILDDLEQGGWLGFNNKAAREEGWYEYNRQLLMREKGQLHYLFYMFRWKLDMYKSALFPSREKLALHYPYIQNHPLLIPWAWLHRLIFRGSKAAKNGVFTSYIVMDEQKINSAAKQRIDMFKSLGMMD